MNIFNQC